MMNPVLLARIIVVHDKPCSLAKIYMIAMHDEPHSVSTVNSKSEFQNFATFGKDDDCST